MCGVDVGVGVGVDVGGGVGVGVGGGVGEQRRYHLLRFSAMYFFFSALSGSLPQSVPQNLVESFIL